MYYDEKFEFPNGFIKKLKEYINYYNTERISLKLKNESGAIPNSFTNN